MIEHVKSSKITIEKMVEKMCHAPAQLFNINKRGFLREGYFADIVIINPETQEIVTKNNIHYKCGWSPFEGQRFTSSIDHTIVSGHMAFSKGKFDETRLGHRLTFN